MIVLLLFLVPLIGGFLSFFIKNDKTVRTWALLTSVITLLISIAGNTIAKTPGQLHFSYSWLGSLVVLFRCNWMGYPRSFAC